MRGLRRVLTTATAAVALVAAGSIAAPAAHADAITNLTDDPSLWVFSDVADIYQWINTASSSTHPRYSTHRIGVLYDTKAHEASPAGTATYLRLQTNFSEISGGADSDTFTSAIRLPAGVTIDSNGSIPMFCRYSPGALFLPDGTAPQTQTVTDGNCVQKTMDLGQGVTVVNTVTLQRGDIWEVYVPVISQRQLDGAASGDAAKVDFLATHGRTDMATLNDVATATTYLYAGAPKARPAANAGGTSPAAASAKAGKRCAKAGAHSGSLKCVKKGSRLVWR